MGEKIVVYEPWDLFWKPPLGSLAGHVLPGVILMVVGFWWAQIMAIRCYQFKTRRSDWRYRSTFAMPFVFMPPHRRPPIESILKFVLITIGAVSEIYAAVNFYRPVRPPGAVRDWFIDYSNGQHATMFMPFIIGSAVEILMHYCKTELPVKLDLACGAFAFFVEGLLFYSHLHNKSVIEVTIHVWLLLIVLACFSFTCLEFHKPDSISFTYGRVISVILQGVWMCHVGVILYPPGKQFKRWNLNDPENLMLISVIFCWDIFFIFAAMVTQIMITRTLMKRFGWFKSIDFSDDYNELDNSPFYSTMSELELNKSFDNSEIKLRSEIDSEDEDSSNA